MLHGICDERTPNTYPESSRVRTKYIATTCGSIYDCRKIEQANRQELAETRIKISRRRHILRISRILRFSELG